MKELTNPQKSIWVTEQYYKGSSVNNICGTAVIDENVDFDKLEKSIEIVCQKHDNFKLKFKIINGEVKQVLSESKKVKVDTIKVEGLKELEKYREKIVKTPFNLENSEIFKFYIFKFENGKGAFMLNVHHLISDAWTLAFICNEIIKTYSALKQNKEIETKAIYSYIDYIESEKEYQKSEKYQRDKKYWEEKFQTIPEVATIPGSKKGNIDLNDATGERKQFTLEKNKVEKIKKYCKINRISLYNFFMAVYAIYISEISNLEEFVIGTPILNRTNFKEKNAAGMFINMEPLRINLNGIKGFKTFIKNIAEDSMQMLKHQKYSYQCLLENLREKNKELPNLYNILISYQITNAQTNEAGIKYRTEWTFNGCCAENMDIQIFDLNDTGSLNIAYDYKTSIYEGSDIEKLHKRIVNIILQVIQRENIEIKDIEIITSTEKKKLLLDFNQTYLEYDTEKPIIKYFEEQVEKTPNNIAIVFENKVLTYRELNQRANSLGAYLRENGVANDTIVGIMQERSAEVLIAILAVLKAGGAYIPIDPSYPDDRIEYMLEDSNAEFLLTDEKQKQRIKTDKKVINIKLNNKEIYGKNEENFENISEPEDLSYLIYTSGSTGTPKGVMLTQQNLSNFYYAMIENIEYLKDEKPHKIISITTVSFDIFEFETLISLTRGLTVYMTNENEQKITAELEKTIKENQIEIIQTTPSVMKFHLDNNINEEDLKSLKYIMLAGEQLPRTLVNNLVRIIPEVTIYNGYGPSETTIFSSTKKVKDKEKVTIGRPIANTQIYILNTNKKLLPQGTIGEMYISGDGVGRGYMNKKEQTESSFISNPFIPGTIMYKTGDLGAFDEKGEITCYGRIDNQVKIRGLRIELSEIERQMQSIYNVADCVVIKKQVNGREALSAYYTQNGQVDESVIKTVLQSKLPQYMVPQYFIRLHQMPHTPNGKIDRKALPDPEIKETNKKIIKPRNEIDEELIKIIENMFNVEHISLTDTIFDLGGDSLTAISLLTKIASKFNVQLHLKDILSNNTIQDISDCIKVSKEIGNDKIKIYPAPKQEVYPLSTAQKRIYYHAKMIGENNTVYNMPGGILVDGLLDENKIKAVLQKIIERHEALRTAFVLQDEDIIQKVDDDIEIEIPVYKEAEKDLKKILNNFSRPFKLEHEPLIRAEIHYLDNKKTLLLIDAHHIIMDGTSLNNFIIEFNRIYNGDTLKKLPIQYKDYAVWENNFNKGEKIKEYEKYWLNKFKNTKFTQLNLPYDYKIPAYRSYKGDKITKVLEEKEFRKIERYAKKIGVSPYIFFISTFLVLLYKYTGQEEIILGTPIANRDINETKRIIGMFVNNIVIDGKINPEETFQDFLNKMKDQILNDLSNQPYPFDMLLKKLGIQTDNSRNPLFDIMFTYQNKEERTVKIDDKECEVIELYNHIAKFNLSLEIKPQIHAINLEYCTDLFKMQTIERMFEHYMNVIDRIMLDSNIKIKDIEIISAKEKNKILNEFNATKLEYSKDRTVIDFFEEQVQKNPNKIAVVFEDKKITYKEINEKANQIAKYIRDRGIKQNDIVGIMMLRSIELLSSIIGVLKAGACYVPIDPTYPQDRIEYMLKDSDAKLLIANHELLNNIKYDNKIFADYDNTEIYSQDIENFKKYTKAENLAYVIYTSGSTGKPKGVKITNQNLYNFIIGMKQIIDLDENKVMLSVTTICFDIFGLELWGSLTSGLTLVLANENEQNTPILMNKLCLKNKVNIMQTTPSRYSLIFEDQENLAFLNNMTDILVGGEPLDERVFIELQKNSNAKIFNMYGPTETTIWSTAKDLTNEKEITIGKPIANTQVYVLDENLKVVPIGIAGGLYISGDGVGQGYLNREDITKERYIENPYLKGNIMYKTGDICKFNEEGELYCFGRIDNQVKIRGLRVELDEIEKVIMQFPNIKKSKVVKQIVNNKEVICAYYVSNGKIKISELRNHLYKYLPNYMVPSYFTELEEFPYTPNGKIDSKALIPNVDNMEREKEIIKPINPKQQIIYDIFKKVLKLKEISIDDNFFEYGGDSITALMVQAQMAKENLSITYSDIFKYPTVRKLSEQVKNNTEVLKIKKAKEAEYYPTSSAQKRVYLTSNIDKNLNLYNITGGLIIDDVFDSKKLQEAVNKVVDRQEVLRTYFDITENGEIVQKIAKNLKVEIKEVEEKTNNIDEIFYKYQKPFDLNKPPLLRIYLIKLPNKKYLLMLDVHHIILDGGSLKIFLNEVISLYKGEELEDLQINYKDFAVWENEQLENNNFEKSKEFWKKQFENEIPILNMPTTYARPVKRDYKGECYIKIIPKETTEKIEKLTQNNNMTPYMIMLSAYYILLYKYTGQDDIIVGTPVSGRICHELEPLLGMFANSLPLRQQLSSNDRVMQFLNKVKEHCVECFSHQEYPFDVLIKELDIPRDTNRNPLFDTMFAYQNNGVENTKLYEISAEYYVPKSKTSKFDISLEVVPLENSMKLSFEYWTGLFDNKFISRFAEHYLNILNSIIENPEIEIKYVSMLDDDEKNKIIYEFNDNKLDYPKDKNIADLFEEQTSTNKNTIAVKYNNMEITYQELDEKSNHIANILNQKGIKTGDVVGVNLNRSIELIISILGILKIGAIYMPLYTEYPKERLEFMLQDSNAKLMICKHDNNLKFMGIKEIMADYKDIEKEKQVLYKNTILPEEIAYIIYTSGSTGKPKGVQIRHENLINFIYAFKEYYQNKINNKDKFLASTNISFDVSIWEIFLPLLSGATLVLYEEETIKDIYKYSEAIIENKITGIYIPPNILEEVYNIIKERKKDIKIDKMLVGVEPIRKTVLNKFYNLNEKMIIINGYGPTETTICCTALEYEKATEEGIVSIGRPLKNDHIYILSKDKNIQPIGVDGEIYVTGCGVGSGYINREEENRKNFLPNTFDKNSKMLYKTGDIARWNEDGTISFKGRNDNQVKFSGHRIELNEITHAIMEYPSIIKAYTDIKKKGDINYIVSYYISEKEIPTTDLKIFLKEKLAGYMIPNFLKQMDKFPLTPNGKIDKAKLPFDFSVKTQYVEPRDEFEKRVAKIFKKLFLLKKISIDDNFFELGGDSLTAIKFQIEALNEGLKITYSDIFSNPTIRLLSENKNKKIIYKIDEKYDYSRINEILAKNDISNLKNNISKKKINNVLLIGATGFLGIHILEQLILSKANKIYCLVRKKSTMEPESRLKNYMEFYFGDKYNNLIGNKIIVINGDITDKMFGQGNEQGYEKISQKVDCVIHTAAIVKHYGDFKKFNDTNVEGTINVINFCKKYNKKLYYISTLSVSGNVAKKSGDEKTRGFKESEFYINQDLSNVYVFTKFEAEKKIFEAALNGLNVCVLRIGNMTNRFSDGKFQINISENAFINRVRSIIKLGVVQEKFLTHGLEFTPVDLCAEAIVKIIESDPEFTVFHLFNHNFLNIGKLLQILEKLEIIIKPVSDEEFRNKIEIALKDSKMRSEINGIITELDKNKLMNIISSVIPNSDFTQKYLKNLDFEWPEIDITYIRKYIEYLKNIKYI